MAAYITPYEIKLEMPDALSTDVLRYDTVLTRNAEQASRFIERITGRLFMPTHRTIYIEHEQEEQDLWLPETLLEISSISMSSDYGATYPDVLVATDYIKYGGKQLYRDQTPYHLLRIDRNGDYLFWYAGQLAVKIEAIAGYHDDYAHAWEASGQTIQDTGGINTSVTTITVTDADEVDVFGHPHLQVGQVLKIENEMMELTNIDPVNEKLTVVRAINGSTAATHAEDKAISIFRPMPVLKRCCAIQAIRWFKRGQQGYTDVSATRDAVQQTYNRMLDLDIIAILASGGLNRIDLT